MNKFYITTTLPYVNADPHIGFGLEIIQADVLARYHRLLGDEVFFNTGTDEHGLKVFRKANELGVETKKYCDDKSMSYLELKKILNLSFNSFIRTTDKNHIKVAQEFWKKCEANGDIYKKIYKIKYCVGCELEKTDSELIDGNCPLHENIPIEIIEEENYFFRFSKYQERLFQLYKDNPDFILPKKRLNEIKSFTERGLEDFSISRLKNKMPWGIEVPGDSEHVMYVWFDALVNYISAIGWPDKIKEFEKWWPAIQLAGKDNLRQQSSMWQAMLMSAGISNSKKILINGFISVDGKKMSKSLGNVITPLEMVERFGSDGTRYLLLNLASLGEDMDVNWQLFMDKYNADLAGGIGNLFSRVTAMVEKYFDGIIPDPVKDPEKHPLRISKELYTWKDAYKNINLDGFKFNEAFLAINKFIKTADTYIENEKPWELFKNNKKDELAWVLYGLLDSIHQLAWMINPFMPETSLKIAKALNIEGLLKENPNSKNSWVNIKPGIKIKKLNPLFLRIDKK